MICTNTGVTDAIEVLTNIHAAEGPKDIHTTEESKGEHEKIRAEICSDTCQHKIKCVLTFIKNDLTLVEIHAIALYFDSDICQIKL